jgi:hypothetical protein
MRKEDLLVQVQVAPGAIGSQRDVAESLA